LPWQMLGSMVMRPSWERSMVSASYAFPKPSLALRSSSRASSMDSLIPSMLNDAIKDRIICSSETLGLCEDFFSAAMTLRYLIPNDKFPNVDKSLGPEAAFAFRFGARGMKSTGEAIYFLKDLKEEPAPHFDAGFFRQVYGERSMYLSR
jgi:hypothetical protein